MAGINVGGTSDWSPELSFVNTMKRGRAWVAHGFVNAAWDTGVPIHLDSNGYPAYLLPNQKVGTMMMRDLQSHGISASPGKPYVVLYDGDGIVTPSMQDIQSFKRIHGNRLEVNVQVSVCARMLSYHRGPAPRQTLSGLILRPCQRH